MTQTDIVMCYKLSNILEYYKKTIAGLTGAESSLVNTLRTGMCNFHAERCTASKPPPFNSRHNFQSNEPNHVHILTTMSVS